MEFRQIHRFTLILPEPFDFRLTVAKPAGWHWSTPGEVFADGTLWSGMYIQDIAAGLKLSADGAVVTVSVYGDAPLDTDLLDLLKSQVWAALGGDEDLPGFYRFAQEDPILSAVTGHLYGMRIGMSRDIFGDVILAILLQMAPMSRSNRMMDALLEYFGRRIIFDGHEVILWPRAEEIARVNPAELRETTKIGYRAERLVKAAQYLAANPLLQDELSALTEEGAARRLTQIPGIGPYSAAIILGTFPIDVWSVVVFSELFLGKSPAHPREAIDNVVSVLTHRWGTWRWFAFVYVVHDLPYLKETYHLSRVT